MTEHSATPWKTNGRATKRSNYGDYRCLISRTANDGVRDFNETLAHALGGVKDEQVVAEVNAAFIVKAVNNHDALVYALTELCQAFEFCVGKDTPVVVEAQRVLAAVGGALRQGERS